jgi:ABC-type multidrug transport system fused ATPase/permease subunit
LHDPESGTDAPPPIQADNSDQAPPAANHTAFLIVGLVCLVAINIILLIDVEVTLAHNNHGQSQEEDEWGFGQVVALLLLVVPLCDFVTSILEIQKAVRSGEKAREEAQHAFNKHLSEAIVQDTFDNHDFKILIDQDANTNVKLIGM